MSAPYAMPTSKNSIKPILSWDVKFSWNPTSKDPALATVSSFVDEKGNRAKVHGVSFYLVSEILKLKAGITKAKVTPFFKSEKSVSISYEIEFIKAQSH